MCFFLLAAVSVQADEILNLYLETGSGDSIITYFEKSGFSDKLKICTLLPSSGDGDCNFLLEFLSRQFPDSPYETEQCIRTILAEIISNDICEKNNEGFLLLINPFPVFSDVTSYQTLLDWVTACPDPRFRNIVIKTGQHLLEYIPEDGRIAPALASVLELYIRTAFSVEYSAVRNIAAQMAVRVRNYSLYALFRKLDSAN
ncbi:MAG: hypothetical protein JW874_13160 [Spirochaetales bacterium]|nr:hypothetical protein [Spirochaetales bacterium]